jgi:tetratricopeptide (TPR) repeat protein
MVAKKSTINLILACMVVALAAIAATFIYRSSNRPEVQTETAPAPSGSQLPQNHPPVDMANRLAALVEMSAKDPQNADLKTQIGNIYYDLNQFEKAIEFYQQSLKIRPQDPNVETDLATSFHYLGQDDKALEILDKILGYSPNFSQALFNKGIVLISGKKDVKAGIAVWEELLRLNPGFDRKADIEKTIRQLKASAR